VLQCVAVCCSVLQCAAMWLGPQGIETVYFVGVFPLKNIKIDIEEFVQKAHSKDSGMCSVE